MTETTTKPTGVCPVCGRRRRLTKAGRLWKHGKPGTFPPKDCPGRGQQPRPDYMTVTDAKRRLGVGGEGAAR